MVVLHSCSLRLGLRQQLWREVEGDRVLGSHGSCEMSIIGGGEEEGARMSRRKGININDGVKFTSWVRERTGTAGTYLVHLQVKAVLRCLIGTYLRYSSLLLPES